MEESLSPEANSFAQLFTQFPVISSTHMFIPIFTTAWLTLSHVITLAHLSSVLTYILHWTSLLRPICLVHFKTSCWCTKMRDRKKLHTVKPRPCSQTQSTVFPQCHTHSYENMLTHKHVFISIVMLSESRKGSKTLQSCSAHYSKIFSSRFLDSAIFIP